MRTATEPRIAFRQTDLTKALKAMAAAGVPVVRVEIEPSGKIILFSSGEREPTSNTWDDLYGLPPR